MRGLSKSHGRRNIQKDILNKVETFQDNIREKTVLH